MHIDLPVPKLHDVTVQSSSLSKSNKVNTTHTQKFYISILKLPYQMSLKSIISTENDLQNLKEAFEHHLLKSEAKARSKTEVGKKT